jgi:predicted dienelactone hydrolase
MMKRLLPLLIFTAACSSAPNQQATTPVTMKIGNYSADMGPSPVGVIPAATLHDAQRNKDVEVSIEYPTRGSAFPVIVFSHGYGSSDHEYEALISYWTSNGYVCIRPSHADAGLLRQTPREAPPMQPSGQRQRRGAQPQQQGQVTPIPQHNPMEEIWDREREPQWQNRVADVKLVLDSLDDLERRFPELMGKMDHGKIGASGHSYGAFTAMLMAGMNGSADSRIRALVAMSPPGPSTSRGLTAQSFATVKIPTMFMTGTNDRGANESEDANWRKQAFDDSPAGDKYFVLIDGARHSSFTGQIGFFDSSPMSTMPQPSMNPYGQQQVPPQQQRGAMVFSSDRRIFQMIKITSLAFWDAYLKNDSSARELLHPEKYESSFTGAHLTAK